MHKSIFIVFLLYSLVHSGLQCSQHGLTLALERSHFKDTPLRDMPGRALCGQKKGLETMPPPGLQIYFRPPVTLTFDFRPP